MCKVLLIGEIMEVLQALEEGAISDAESFKASVSGAELNVAVGLKRLGIMPRYMAKVGADPRAERIRRFLKDNGIEDDLIITDREHPTGSMVKGIPKDGHCEIYYYRETTAAGFISEEDINSVSMENIRAAYFTGIFPTISKTAEKAAGALVKRAKENNAAVIFDPNLRSRLWKTDERTVAVLNEFASKSDIFLPSVSEAKILCGLSEPEEIADHYLALGTGKIIVKLGKRGAYYKSRVESGIAPTFRADAVIDTMGAGDGFAAGLISGICEEIPLGEAVVRANAVGCMQIQSKSENADLPTMEQLRDYMLNHRFMVDCCKEF